MFAKEDKKRFTAPPRYGLILTWLAAILGVIAAMRFTALPHF